MILRVLIVLLISITFISCSTDDNIDLRELNANRQLWESSQVKNYSWNERLACYCAGVLDRDVFVENEVKIKVVFNEDSLYGGLTYEDVFNASNTIEDSFNFIESLMTKDVASLSVEYDEVYGFPKSINIDYIKDAIDDEISYVYANFEITN